MCRADPQKGASSAREAAEDATRLRFYKNGEPQGTAFRGPSLRALEATVHLDATSGAAEVGFLSVYNPTPAALSDTIVPP